MKIQHNQAVPGNEKHRNGNHCHYYADDKLEPESVANSLMAFLPIILSGENSRTGNAAENTDIKHRHKLVHNGNAAHLLRAHLPHHNIIQHVDKIRYAVLNNDRNHNEKNHSVKSLISYVLSPNTFLHTCILPDSEVF